MRLHSAYDPVKEANQFINGQNLQPGIFLVVDGLGYLCQVLRSQFPKAKILQIFPNSECFEERNFEVESFWHPSQSQSFLDFLDNNLDPLGFFQLNWVVWPPTRRLFTSQILIWEKQLSQFLKREQGSYLTFRRFGKRWLINSIKNLVSPKPWLRQEPGSMPILIAASGPSLSFSLETLWKNRSKYQLWALPSSLDFLQVQGITPDLVLNTDGSHFAAENLFLLDQGTPILQGLSSIPAQGINSPRLMVNQGFEFEKKIWQCSTVKPLHAPPQGTVAATALSLALQLTDGPVILAGLDFAWYKGLPHVQPHTWDRQWEKSFTRFDSKENAISRRFWTEAEIPLNHEWRTNPALEVYGDFFQTWNLNQDRVYRLFPSPWDFSWMKTIPGNDLEVILEKKPPVSFLLTKWTNRPGEKAALELVDSWEKDLKSPDFIEKRLNQGIKSGEWAFLTAPEQWRLTKEGKSCEPLKEILRGFLNRARQELP